MANNCLVTKLKGVVQNEMLPDFGYQWIKFHSDTDTTYGDLKIPNAVAGKKLKIKGDGYFSNSNGDNLGKETSRSTGPANITHIHMNGDVLLEIENGSWSGQKDFIIPKGSYTFDLDTNIMPNIFDSSSYVLDQFTVYPNQLKGKLSNILPNPAVFTTVFLNPLVDSPQFTGSLDSITFANDAKLFPYLIALNNCTAITGNLKSFLDRLAPCVQRSLIEKGQSTRNVAVQLSNCPGIMYEGSSIGNRWSHTVVFSNDGTWNLQQ